MTTKYTVEGDHLNIEFDKQIYGISPKHKKIAKSFNSKVKVVESLLPLQNKTILDVGCGDGRLLYYLSKRTPHATGIDINNFLLERAKKLGLNVENQSGYDLKFEDNSFDVVICSNYLHHMDIPKALKEMSRVSKEYIIIMEPNFKHWLIKFDSFTHVGFVEIKLMKDFEERLKQEIQAQNLKLIHQTRTGFISYKKIPSFIMNLMNDKRYKCFNVVICRK